MDPTVVSRLMTKTFPGVEVAEASGDAFFLAGPDRRLPFATLVTGDRYDTASDLDRPRVFRLNIGVSRATYQALFGTNPARVGPDGIVDTGHDFTALGQMMPHAVYAPQFWGCVLNPGPETWETVRSLLTEAHARAERRQHPTPAPPPPDSAPG